MKPDIYLIHPVRNISSGLKNYLDGYVDGIESQGKKVHYPIRDVDQNDPTGLRILSEHRDAIKYASEARLYFDSTSTGSMFDLGMIFMAEKPLKIINPKDMGKMENCVSDFVKHYAINIPIRGERINYAKMVARREKIRKLEIIRYAWGKTPENLFDFGMVFMSRKPIILLNDLERTPHKSFENVLLELDNQARKIVYSK